MRREWLTQPAFLADLTLLAQFDTKNLELGVKLHQDSDDVLRQAAQLLHAKGVITAADGGYLTPFGVSLLEHLDHLLLALKS